MAAETTRLMYLGDPLAMPTSGSGLVNPIAGAEEPRKLWVLFAIFSVLWSLCFLFGLPVRMNFFDYVAGDAGAALRLDRLIAEGRTPKVDFGYYYGLLSAVFGRGWFAMFGRVPWAIFAMAAIGGFIVAYCYASIAVSLRLRLPQIAFLVVALPLCFYTGESCIPIHVLEPVPLILALAAQSRGRLPLALAFATVAALMKPVLGYVYGLILLLAWADECRRTLDFKRFLLGLAPSALIGTVVLVGLACVYGAAETLSSLFPGFGMRAYRLEGLGILNAGRAFWAGSPGAGIGFYFGTPAAAWVIGSALLVLGGLALLPKTLRGKGDRRTSLTLACAILHVVFVVFAFANQYSWVYYYYILVIGLAALWAIVSEARPRAGACGWVVVALFALANYASFKGNLESWRTIVFDRELNLFANPTAAAEWARIRELAKDRAVFVLTYQGGAHEIEPLVASNDSWLLSHSQAPKWERERVFANLEAADVLVVPVIKGLERSPNHPQNAAVFAEAIAPFDRIETGAWFEVRRRSNRK